MVQKIGEENSGGARVSGFVKRNKGRVGVVLVVFIVGLVVIASL